MDLGLTDYEECYRTQREMVARRKLGEIGDTLILTEHSNVFTIGRTGGKENLLADAAYLRQKGIKVLDVDRGGDITFHGPGQLVVYPIIELKEKWRDLHKYMRNLEDVVIKFLKRYSVRSGREPGRTGVWASGKKVASIGIGVSNWVTYHGMSININPDLEFFNMIYPCGLKGIKIASLKSLCGKDITVGEAKNAVISDFDSVFNSGRIYFIPACTDEVKS
ncbi:MAG: lipoyl(octanoyl) transferase LipB [Candidatus Omnitrophica bacterium]|nr:lipoyl(octanoyl) transferase LipB [Candidatus Omnitrophota bacterium]